MATIKKPDATENVTVENATDAINKDNVSNETTTSKKESAPKVELPKHIDAILKSFPTYAELYVDAFGGLFTADTKPELRSKAILYQNPYYNN